MHTILKFHFNSKKDQSTPQAQHWAMQPPPGFGAPTPLGVQQTSTPVQAHTKFIPAGSEIESKFPIILFFCALI